MESLFSISVGVFCSSIAIYCQGLYTWSALRDGAQRDADWMIVDDVDPARPTPSAPSIQTALSVSTTTSRARLLTTSSQAIASPLIEATTKNTEVSAESPLSWTKLLNHDHTTTRTSGSHDNHHPLSSTFAPLNYLAWESSTGSWPSSDPDPSLSAGQPCPAGVGLFREKIFYLPKNFPKKFYGSITCDGSPFFFGEATPNVSRGECRSRCLNSTVCNYVQYQDGNDRADGPVCHMYDSCTRYRTCYKDHKCGVTYWRDCGRERGGRSLRGLFGDPSFGNLEQRRCYKWLDIFQNGWFVIVGWAAALYMIMSFTFSVVVVLFRLLCWYFSDFIVPRSIIWIKFSVDASNVVWNVAATVITSGVKLQPCIHIPSGFANRTCYLGMLIAVVKLAEIKFVDEKVLSLAQAADPASASSIQHLREGSREMRYNRPADRRTFADVGYSKITGRPLVPL